MAGSCGAGGGVERLSTKEKRGGTHALDNTVEAAAGRGVGGDRRRGGGSMGMEKKNPFLNIGLNFFFEHNVLFCSSVHADAPRPGSFF